MYIECMYHNQINPSF